MPSDCDRQAFDCHEAASPAAAAAAGESAAGATNFRQLFLQAL